MLCYRDRTYCTAPCAQTACTRLVTPQLESEAKSFGLPLALTDYSSRCADFTPVEAQEAA